MFHTTRRCLNNLTWSNGSLICSKCKRILAMRYKYKEEVKILVFPEYKKYGWKIRSKEVAERDLEEGGFVGHIQQQDISDILYNIGEKQDDVLPLQEGD